MKFALFTFALSTRQITKSKITGLLFIFFISVSFIVSSPDSASAKPLFASPDGNFTVYDRGEGFFRRNTHSKLYISIKFDLVIRDENILIEPEGIQTYHIAHFDDKDVKARISGIATGFYQTYLKCRNDITKQIGIKTSEIEKIKIEQNKIFRGKDRSNLTPEENRKYTKGWEKIKGLSDELTDFYHDETKKLIQELSNRHDALCRTKEYMDAMGKNATYKVVRGRIIDIGSGVFALSGSVTRAALGDIGSIISAVTQFNGLSHSLYNAFRKSNPTELIEYYDDFDDCMESLKKSNDPSSIRSNLSLLEKSFDSYINKRNKFTDDDIDKTIEIQQFSTQIDEIEKNLEIIMTKKQITGNSIREFNNIRRSLQNLKNDQEIVTELAQSLTEAYNDSKSLIVKKPILKSQKEMELKNLVETSKNKNKRVGKNIESYIMEFINVSENVTSTLMQIYNISMK